MTKKEYELVQTTTRKYHLKNQVNNVRSRSLKDTKKKYQMQKTIRVKHVSNKRVKRK